MFVLIEYFSSANQRFENTYDNLKKSVFFDVASKVGLVEIVAERVAVPNESPRFLILRISDV